MKQFYVYTLIDPRNGSVFYVGKGHGDRSEYHLRASIAGSHRNPKLSNKIKKIIKKGLKYGVEFVFSSCDEQQCFEKEIFYIAFLGRKCLCNLTAGGEGMSNPSEEVREKLRIANIGKIHSDESRAKMSESRKGEKNHFFGKTHSEETRNKMSLDRAGKGTMLGKKHSAESLLKMSKVQKGRKVSAEGKANMSAATSGEKHPMYGKHHSEETRQKMSESAKGYIKSETHCLNISKSKRGKNLSEEHKAKISLSGIARWASRKDNMIAIQPPLRVEV